VRRNSTPAASAIFRCESIESVSLFVYWWFASEGG
jgi:hypothetical protein